MRRRVFIDQDVTPTDTLLRKLLGSNIVYYMTILETSAGLCKKWQFIKGNGWLLKVDDNNNALYYLIACDDGIIINLTVREKEMESFLRNEGLDKIYTELKHATKYSGGYAISFEIKSLEESRNVATFLAVHIKDRLSKQELTPKPAYHRTKHVSNKIRSVIK